MQPPAQRSNCLFSLHCYTQCLTQRAWCVPSPQTAWPAPPASCHHITFRIWYHGHSHSGEVEARREKAWSHKTTISANLLFVNRGAKFFTNKQKKARRLVVCHSSHQTYLKKLGHYRWFDCSWVLLSLNITGHIRKVIALLGSPKPRRIPPNCEQASRAGKLQPNIPSFTFLSDGFSALLCLHILAGSSVWSETISPSSHSPSARAKFQAWDIMPDRPHTQWLESESNLSHALYQAFACIQGTVRTRSIPRSRNDCSSYHSLCFIYILFLFLFFLLES